MIDLSTNRFIDCITDNYNHLGNNRPFYNQMVGETVCILNHFIPSGRIVEDVVSVFRPRTELSGLGHTRSCGPPTRPSETSGCILLLCKLQPSLGTNSSGLQPDSCSYKSTQSSFVQYIKLTLTKQSMNARYICDCNWIVYFYNCRSQV